VDRCAHRGWRHLHDATKQAHDREFREVRENFKRIFEKLDTIELALRK
jgi:hypothetical protein